MMVDMKQSVRHLVAVSIGFVVTIITLFLVTAWNFQPTDLAALFIFLVGIGVGFWIASVLHE